MSRFFWLLANRLLTLLRLRRNRLIFHVVAAVAAVASKEEDLWGGGGVVSENCFRVPATGYTRITHASRIIHPISFHSPCTSFREIESLLLSSPTSA